MSLAIGMVELNSIAKGIEVCDYMVKEAEVELLRSTTVCPGKYIILVGGETADVKAAMKEGLKQGGEYVVDSLLIPNVHPEVLPATAGVTQIYEYGAVGVIEYYSIASAILAADAAVKAANVTLIEVHMGFAIGGKGYVVLTGDVAAVRAGVEAAKEATELLVNAVVIPRPDKKLFDSLM